LTLASTITGRWFGKSGVLELLLSGATPGEAGTSSSWSVLSWGPWPVAHGVSGEAATNTGFCVTSSEHTYNHSRGAFQVFILKWERV